MNIICCVAKLLDLGNTVIRYDAMAQELALQVSLAAITGHSCFITQVSGKALAQRML